MKSLKNKMIITAALLSGAAIYFSSTSKSPVEVELIPEDQLRFSEATRPLEASSDDHSHNHLPVLPVKEESKASPVANKVVEDSVLAEFKELKDIEKKSLSTMVYTMAEAIRADSSMEAFVESLEKLKLKPIIMNDQNEYTGEMNVVRTKGALPGTRYVHAQYFTNPDGSKFIEHISFELKPGKDSFSAAKKMVQAQFGVGEPIRSTDKFASWKIPGRTIWVKVLEGEDLHDPNNSYDPKTDSGTVRIGNELEIH